MDFLIIFLIIAIFSFGLVLVMNAICIIGVSALKGAWLTRSFQEDKYEVLLLTLLSERAARWHTIGKSIRAYDRNAFIVASGLIFLSFIWGLGFTSIIIISLMISLHHYNYQYLKIADDYRPPRIINLLSWKHLKTLILLSIFQFFSLIICMPVTISAVNTSGSQAYFIFGYFYFGFCWIVYFTAHHLLINDLDAEIEPGDSPCR